METLKTLRTFADARTLENFFHTTNRILLKLESDFESTATTDPRRDSVRAKLSDLYSPKADSEFNFEIPYMSLAIYDRVSAKLDFMPNLDTVARTCLYLAMRQRDFSVCARYTDTGMFDNIERFRSKIGTIGMVVTPVDFISLWGLLMPHRSTYPSYAQLAVHQLISRHILDDTFARYKASTIALAALIIYSKFPENQLLQKCLGFVIKGVSGEELLHCHDELKAIAVMEGFTEEFGDSFYGVIAAPGDLLDVADGSGDLLDIDAWKFPRCCMSG